MKVAVVYIYAGIAGEKYHNYAARFINSYYERRPRTDHESIIVINGKKPTAEVECLFSAMPRRKFLSHDNSGYDIGAYQFAARSVPCDLMVFFGASTYIKAKNWLERMVESFEKHGDAIYGAMGNKGANLKLVNPTYPVVYPHIRTTAFWLPPKLMNQYPVRVTRPNQRHPFEYGKNNITEWVRRKGKKAFVVSTNVEFEYTNWDNVPNGYHRGDQSELLAGDHLTEPPYYKCA